MQAPFALSRESIRPGADVVLPGFDNLRLFATVESGPFGLFLEETHGVDVLPSGSEREVSSNRADRYQSGWKPHDRRAAYVVLIDRKAMIDTSGQDEQIARLHSDPHPSILPITDVEVARPLQDIPDLFVLVHVFVVEHIDLVLVGGAHGAGRDGDFVAVGVGAGLGEVFDLGRG